MAAVFVAFESAEQRQRRCAALEVIPRTPEARRGAGDAIETAEAEAASKLCAFQEARLQALAKQIQEQEAALERQRQASERVQRRR